MTRLPPEDRSYTSGYLPPSHGRLALTLAILGLTCCGPVFGGLPAWLIARGDLKKIKEGRMDPRDKGMLRAASILGIISLLPVVIVLVLLGPYSVTTMIEESRWKPQDSSHLDVVNTSIGNSGMLFDIYAPAGVAAIYRRGGSPLPWGPQHDRVQFWSVIGDNPGQIKVLVKRSFDSEDEYFFGINSRDGYWTTVSGKWKKPDLSDAKWNELRSEAER